MIKPADYAFVEAVVVAFVILFGFIIVQTLYG
jgi:hypothetical protein